MITNCLPKSIFRAYDIRGVVPTELNEDAYVIIAKALAKRLKALNRTVAYVGRDGRLTSEVFVNAVKKGLLSSGIDVVDLGQIPTPLMYFATSTTPIDSGFMVTGSHNPSNYNGLKMVLAGKTLVQKDIDELYAIIHQASELSGEGKLSSLDIMPLYLNTILGHITLEKPLKVVLDGGNGVAGPLALTLLKALKVDVIPIFCEIDGRFPNHHPDPSIPENLTWLIDEVKRNQADIGLALDGDGDRVGVVTNEGDIIWPDRLMMLYAKDLLSREKGLIVYDVKCSSQLGRFIEEKGGQYLMCPTGHSIVKGVMKQENALLAGEMSGHIFFKERWFGFDDGLYSAVRLLEILSQTTETAHAVFKQLPNSLSTPEIKIPIDDSKKFEFMQLFASHITFPDAVMITIDGVRVEYPDGWGLLRASNTTPCLIARFEADSKASLLRIQKALLSKMIQFEPFSLDTIAIERLLMSSF